MFKNKYVALWLLLALALVGFITFSFVEDFKIGEWQPKKGSFRDLLTEKDKEDLPIAADSLSLDTEIISTAIKTDSLPQNIFIFGDSMTFNLALRLAQYAKKNGHTIHSVNWDSSNTKIWAEHDTLSYYLKLYRPTQVFISLGSNEMYFKDPSSRLPYVKKILEVIDTIPYVWIGPPNWKEDTGINDMIERACKSGSFFRSAGMEFKRKKDNIHPTREASALWVDSIMRWIPKSSHPFIVEVPGDSIGKANPNIIFLKALNK